MRTPIRAVDEILLPQRPERVWPVVADVAGYARWWPRSVGVRALNDVAGAGAEVEIRPRGGRAFRCCVTDVDEPRSLCLRYGGGFIEGVGEWRLEPVAGGTRVRYAVDVAACGWAAAVLGRVVDFGRLHSRWMQQVLQNLAGAVAAADGSP